jgi:alpha-NAC-related protein
MFGKINPKQMQSMMKQMGISQSEIPASRVIIEKEDGRLIIENPSVTRIKMNGQESFQISGEIQEESKGEELEEENFEEDVKTIAEQTGVDKGIVAIELEKNDGDIAETIIALKEKK